MKDNNVALLTGSTGGLGSAAADILAKQGWSLILVNRSQQKAKQQVAELSSRYPSTVVESFVSDFMDLEDIRRSADAIAANHSKIDALYHFSGILTSEKRLSKQGFESHYAVNTLAPYLLTERLKPLMSRAVEDGMSMVVTMSSGVVTSAKLLDIDRLSNPETINGLMGAYAQSKLALTAYGAAIADSLKGDNILIRSIDPGATRTPMTNRGDGMPFFIRWMVPLLFAKPEKQAAIIVNASKPEALSEGTGILVVKGKKVALPKSIDSAQLQQQLLNKIIEDAAQ